MFDEYKAGGLGLVALNYGDKPEIVRKYIADNKFTFTILLGADTSKTAEKFGVLAYPTNYLLDADGNIVARFVGFDEAGLRKEIEKLGIAKK
jgi:hypothetical protein